MEVNREAKIKNEKNGSTLMNEAFIEEEDTFFGPENLLKYPQIETTELRKVDHINFDMNTISKFHTEVQLWEFHPFKQFKIPDNLQKRLKPPQKGMKIS